jgi:hypothetical protein
LNFYLPGGFEKVIMEFGVPAKSRTLPPPNLKADVQFCCPKINIFLGGKLPGGFDLFRIPPASLTHRRIDGVSCLS